MSRKGRRYTAIFASCAIAAAAVWLGLWARDRSDRSASELSAQAPRGLAAGPFDAGAPAALRRQPAPSLYEHPVIADDSRPVRPPDCSQAALDRVIGAAGQLEKNAADALSTKAKDRSPEAGCAADSNPSKVLQDQLLDRVSGCVGQDGPLDDQWNVVESALLAVGSCIECTDVVPARLAKCRHARRLLGTLQKK